MVVSKSESKIATKSKTIALLLITILLGACGAEESAESAESAETGVTVAGIADDGVVIPPQAADCVDESNIAYLCGLTNGEDILRLGNTEWLLASGMNGELSNNPAINGKIHLVNHEEKSFEILFPGDNPVFDFNEELFSTCPGPLDITNFSSHGLALKTLNTGPSQYRLYMTSHGAREAIEIFEIDAFLKPTIKWVGCVPMPNTSWTNSITILGDDGFFATQFMDPTGSGMQGVTAGEITGHVFEWHPGQDVTVLAGTELSGPNGITISDDGRWLYVAAFGTHEIARFDLSSNPPAKETVPITIAPDNIRWSSEGTLYATGGNVTETCPGPECGMGWSVIELVPYSMQASRLTGVDETAAMQGVSSALLVDDEIWIGTYSGDRLGILPKP